MRIYTFLKNFGRRGAWKIKEESTVATKNFVTSSLFNQRLSTFVDYPCSWSRESPSWILSSIIFDLPFCQGFTLYPNPQCLDCDSVHWIAHNLLQIQI